jgi:hypothetical protein
LGGSGTENRQGSWERGNWIGLTIEGYSAIEKVVFEIDAFHIRINWRTAAQHFVFVSMSCVAGSPEIIIGCAWRR